ncbi:transporter [Streptomyces sp. NBC_00503]|uniref:transporter n=1 Tax=Streptomyces sp. NBC_00503 TaxID=2903659 RepID=UPI002E805B3F|nr:transporter [Streptomyces sp. NBC_00503]WUD82000.1 transporter [Streptomyces sp. NBC_00503]
MSTATATPSTPSGTATVPLTPIFVRLKLSLLKNGLKGSSKRKAAYFGALAFALVAAFFVTLSLALLRGNEHASAVVVLLAAVLALGWTFMPLFFPTGDETLDPSRLVMLPLHPRPLVRALLVSSLVGIGPLFTLCLAIGSAIALAHGAAGAVAAVLAVPLLLLGCVALARAVATANVRLLTSRKGRDLALLSGLLIAVGAQVANFAGQRLFQSGGLEKLQPAEEIVRWLPPASAIGMVDSASEGSYGMAAGQLLVTLAALALLLWFWERSLTKLMVTPDGSTIAAAKQKKERGAGAGGGLWSLLPDDRTGATMQRSLRYIVRDPKTKAAWVSALAIGLIIPVANALQGQGSVYLACFGSGMIGVQMYNQFGQDTSAFWMVAQTISGPRDAYLELRARALALSLITVPYTAVVTVVTAALVGDWPGLPPGLGLALALLGSMLCTGSLASARFPYSIPTDGAFKNVAPGQGALAWMGIFGGLFASALICSPVIVLTVVMHGSAAAWILLPVGAAWGTLAAWAGLRLAAPTVARKLPEILMAVSKG